MTQDDLTPDMLRSLYEDELLTDEEIGRRFDLNQSEVSSLRDKYNIDTMSKGERRSKRLPDLSERQEDLIMGSLLGDGHMSSSSAKVAKFSENHCIDQEEYCRWKEDILSPFVTSTRYTQKQNGDQTYRRYGIETYSCTQLRPFYDLFYPPPNHQRRFPEDIRSLINPFSLAVWYMDDGSLSNGHSARISFGLDDQSLYHVCEALQNMGLYPEIFEDKRDPNVCTIRFRDDHAFFDMVRPHIPSFIMSYKLPDHELDKMSNGYSSDEVQQVMDEAGDVQDVANCLDIAKSTVRRRLQGYDTGERTGRPRTISTDRSLRVFLSNCQNIYDRGGDLNVETIRSTLNRSLNIDHVSEQDIMDALNEGRLEDMFDDVGFSDTDMNRRRDDVDLEKGQGAMVAGTLICGSRVAEVGSESARFVQTSQNEDWIQWKSDLLSPFVSSVTEDNSGDGHRLMTTSSDQFVPFLDFYTSSSSPSSNGRMIPQHVISEHADHPLFFLTWFFEGRHAWDVKDNNIYITVFDSYSQSDCYRLARGIRSNHDFSISVRTDDDVNYDLVLNDCGVSLMTSIEQCAIDRNAEFLLPLIPDRSDIVETSDDLSPERAARLNQVFGMSFEKMSDLYDVSKTTCWRRAKSCDCDKGFDTSGDTISLDKAGRLLGDVGSKHEDDQVGTIVSILQRTPFPFPSKLDKESLSSCEKREEFEKLCDKELSLNGDDEIRPDSLYGLDLCRLYFPNRYKAQYRDKPSAYEAWHREEYLERAVKFQLKFGDPATPRRVRRAIQMNVRTPSLFKPAQAKYICGTYGREGGHCWDPCAGYGGRLLGAVASDMHYIGTDVDEATVRGNISLSEDLDVQDRVEVHQTPAEDFSPPSGLDLVMTSPPYWNRERYSRHEDQSFHRYADLDDWSNGFLRPIIETSYDSLKDGGYFVLNIADLNRESSEEETIPLESITKDLCDGVGFEFQHQIKMPIRSGQGRSWEPILTHRK